MLKASGKLKTSPKYGKSIEKPEIPPKIWKNVVVEIRSSIFSTSVQPNPLLTHPNCRARREGLEFELRLAKSAKIGG